jgi:excisionase family DNA binding protein
MRSGSLSTGAVAAHCGVDRATILRWIKAGKLAAYITPGGHHRVLAETLSGFLANMGLPADGFMAGQMSISSTHSSCE